MKCKSIYNEDMDRKIKFVMQKNRPDPFLGSQWYFIINLEQKEVKLCIVGAKLKRDLQVKEY